MTKSRDNVEIVDPIIVKDYLLLDILGTGTFGKVRLGINRTTRRKVAVKILDKHMMIKLGAGDTLGRELNALSGRSHPHVVRIHELIDTMNTCFIIMDYVDGGELFDYISQNPRLTEYDSIRIMRQILSAVNFCHNNRVCHRDLKPENIMLDKKKNIKLGDFGLCNSLRDGECLMTPCGSPNYAAPEVICGHPYSGPEIDIWSCGVILYVLLCGCLPFDDDEMSMLFHKIKLGKYLIPGYISKDAKWLLERMLDVNPASRITLSEIFLHPWFKGCNIKENRTEALDYDITDHYSTRSVHGGTSDSESSHPGYLLKAPKDADVEVSNSLVLKFNHYNPRWSIGVSGYRSEEDCVRKVLETLKSMGYKWNCTPNLKIYFRRQECEENTAPVFCLHVYKVRHRNFMADLMLCDGKLMPALEEGVKIVEELQRHLPKTK